MWVPLGWPGPLSRLRLLRTEVAVAPLDELRGHKALVKLRSRQERDLRELHKKHQRKAFALTRRLLDSLAQARAESRCWHRPGVPCASRLPVCDCAACIDVNVWGCGFLLHQVGTEDGRVTKGFSWAPKEEGLVPGREEASLAQSHPLPTWEQYLIGRQQEEHVF